MTLVLKHYDSNGIETNWHSTVQSAIEGAKALYQEHSGEPASQFNFQIGDLAGVPLYMCEFHDTDGAADKATCWMSGLDALDMLNNPDEKRVDLEMFDSEWITDLN